MTHINAFFGEVELKRAKLEEAKADLEDAERRLEEKKIEDGFVDEPTEAEVAEEFSDEPKVKDDKSKKTKKK